MKTHPETQQLIDLAQGALSPQQRDAIRRHLDDCVSCRQVFGSISGPVTAPNLQGIEGVTRTADPLVGKQLGEYRVMERLAVGGMGVLYRGEHPVIGKAVAIKVLHPQMARDPSFVQRLIGEARSVNSIRHPNIVDVFNFGQLDDSRHYIVMELLDGLSLAALLRERVRLEPHEVLTVLEQSLSALEAAHAAGVIHRDLKPENIFVDPRRDGWHVTLLDFGAAKQMGSPALTDPDLVIGTPSYMSPEMIKGDEPMTGKIDVYAMGVVAWYLLTGKQPFGGTNSVEVMRAHIEAPIPSAQIARASMPSVTNSTSTVPIELERLVSQMMSKSQSQRPTAAEARREVKALRRRLASVPTVRSAPVPVPLDVLPKTEIAPQPLLLEPVTLPGDGKAPAFRPAVLTTEPGKPGFGTPPAKPPPPQPQQNRTGVVALVLFLGAVGIGAAVFWFLLRPH
ncbi:MAG: protein kinase [Myxococcaceae bacterium]